MTGRSWKIGVFLPLFLFLVAPPARAQQGSIDELRKQIEALTATVKAMQKDLQEIKTLLQGRAAPAPAPSVVLDLAGRPAQGQNTAKLLLIEFSDYQ